jgi:predicted DCC family thiol-disulfide oxidoreductase YuxK
MAGVVKAPSAWSPNPFRCNATGLSMPLLLVAKLLALCVLVRMIWMELPAPFLPFAPFLDFFTGSPVFAWVLRGSAVAGAVAVLFNFRVRAACLLVSAAFLVGSLASRPSFENNRMFVGCIFFLLSLFEQQTREWLVRFQVMLVFFSAALNKLLDPSWRSGQFFNYWSTVFVNKAAYFQVASMLPDMSLARAMSWATIVMEFSIAFCLLFRRTRIAGIWIGLLLSLGMNVLTERTFGVFFYAMPICYLAFVDWPRSRITVLFDGDCGFCSRTRQWMERFDLEKLFHWQAFQRASDLYGISTDALRQRLYLVTEKRSYSGFDAFKIMALYNPLTYFAMLIVLMGPQSFFLRHRSFVVVLFLAFFSPPFAPVGRAAYALIARNRHRILPAETCSMDRPKA